MCGCKSGWLGRASPAQAAMHE